MSVLRRIDRLAPLLGLLAGAAILLLGLGRHGIWDPTELAFAESLGASPLTSVPKLHGALVRTGFELFGRRDVAGRVFGAAATLLAAVAAMGLVRRHLDARASAYAAIVAAATPLAVLNARWMVGDGAAIGMHSLVGLGLFLAAFDRTDGSAITVTRPWVRVFGVLVAIAASIAGTMFRGALLVVLPPLLAITATVLLEPIRSVSGRVRIAIAVVGVSFAAMLSFLVVRDAAVFSVLLGGVPGGESPPTFERFLQIAFHTLAPVSPLFVLGAGRVLAGSGDDEVSVERQRLRIALLLWATFAFGASTLFAARYGSPTYLAIVPVAAIVAITLREAETGPAFGMASVLVFSMLLGLLLRDYALYPASPLAGVPVTAPSLAADFQPRAIWAALFLAFGAAFAFGTASKAVDGREYRAILAPFRDVFQWLFHTPAGLTTAILLLAVESVVIVLGAFGDAMHMASLVSRIARPLAVALPLAVPAIAFVVLSTLYLFARLGGARMVPAVVVVAAIGAYLQGPFLIDLSGDLSPRDLFATFNELRGRGEPLAQFDVRSHAVDYYVDGRAEELGSRAEVVERLASARGDRTWVMFRRAVLPTIDREVRAISGRHVYLAHATNEEFVLATNRPLPGRGDQNPLARSVITASRAHPQHPLAIRYRDLELIGYDLEVPNGDSVGAGQSFRVTWYWKPTTRSVIDWRIFVHIDGSGQRLNGDHDPVEGLLPTSQWTVGDVIRDTQELDVPASYPPDDYRIFIGLFAGNDRMPVVSGPDGGENRGIAGTLRVR